jgi:cytoskeletal protein CcmA (bactofilin family)
MFGGKRETTESGPVRVQAPPPVASGSAPAATSASATATTASATSESANKPATNPTKTGPDASRIVSGERPNQPGFAPRHDGRAKETRASDNRPSESKQNSSNQASGGAVLSSRENRTLTVGRSIKLRGEIAACDHLIVEGEVDAETAAATKLEISREGTVRGKANVETASVTGTFEGSLTVKGLLFVEAGGRVSGEVTCGELEVRRGGKVEGSLTYSGKSED